MNADVNATARLRHLGFEDDEVTAKSEATDVNGIMWESFSPVWQDQGIVAIYGPTR